MRSSANLMLFLETANFVARVSLRTAIVISIILIATNAAWAGTLFGSQKPVYQGYYEGPQVTSRGIVPFQATRSSAALSRSMPALGAGSQRAVSTSVLTRVRASQLQYNYQVQLHSWRRTEIARSQQNEKIERQRKQYAELQRRRVEQARTDRSAGRPTSDIQFAPYRASEKERPSFWEVIKSALFGPDKKHHR